MLATIALAAVMLFTQPAPHHPDVIIEAYEVCLQRTPSIDEIVYWGSVDEAPTLICDSPEARRKLITYLYGAALNRKPEPAAMKFWMTQSRHDIFNGIIFSEEALR